MHAVVKATVEGLGVQSIFNDLGKEVEGHVWGDANAALGIINRTGLGKLRHINTSYLWIQDVAARRWIEFSKILGTENPADLLTEYVKTEVLQRQMTKTGLMHSMEMLLIGVILILKVPKALNFSSCRATGVGTVRKLKWKQAMKPT